MCVYCSVWLLLNFFSWRRPFSFLSFSVRFTYSCVFVSWIFPSNHTISNYSTIKASNSNLFCVILFCYWQQQKTVLIFCILRFLFVCEFISCVWMQFSNNLSISVMPMRRVQRNFTPYTKTPTWKLQNMDNCIWTFLG